MFKNISAFLCCLLALTVLFGASSGCLPDWIDEGIDPIDQLDPIDEPDDEDEIDIAPDDLEAEFTLHLIVEGEGTVSMDPPGGSYRYRKQVALHAEPATGWRFSHWQTDQQNIELWFQKSWTPATVIMNRDKTVRAVFEPTHSPLYNLTVEIEGEGEVAVDPEGPYAPGTYVTLTAIPAIGWHFDRWQGLPAEISDYMHLLMDSDKTVRAVFLENPTVEAPQLSPADGTEFFPSQTVAITCPTPGAEIYYTTDGEDPTQNSTYYEGPFTIQSTQTVKARAYKDQMNPSPITAATYTRIEQVQTPAIHPSGGGFLYEFEISMSIETPGAHIYYTSDGSDPTEADTLYAEPFWITDPATIKARAFKEGMASSEVEIAIFHRNLEPVIEWLDYDIYFEYDEYYYEQMYLYLAVQVTDSDGVVDEVYADLTEIGGASVNSMTWGGEPESPWEWSGLIYPYSEQEEGTITITAYDNEGGSVSREFQIIIPEWYHYGW